ncbi:hypothetical protein [Halorubrum tailed virus BLv36]|nr:hypothetical protein [Halorubrum tailed virus BLv36]
MNFNKNKSRSIFTEIDLTTEGATTVYGNDTEAFVSGVYYVNPSSSARVQLEVSNNGNTVEFIPAQEDGNNIRFGSDIVLGEPDKLQVNVTKTGSGTNDCVVFVTEA